MKLNKKLKIFYLSLILFNVLLLLGEILNPISKYSIITVLLITLTVLITIFFYFKKIGKIN